MYVASTEKKIFNLKYAGLRIFDTLKRRPRMLLRRCPRMSFANILAACQILSARTAIIKMASSAELNTESTQKWLLLLSSTLSHEDKAVGAKTDSNLKGVTSALYDE